MDDGARRRRVLIFWSVAVMLVIIISLSVFSCLEDNGGQSGTPTDVVPPNQENPSDTPIPTDEQGDPQETPDSDISPDSPSPSTPAQETTAQQRAAVTTAALATDALAQSVLQRPAGLQQTLARFVIPANRDRLRRAYAAVGPPLVQAWGYSGIDNARNSASYYVSTQQYRIGRFSGSEASIWLYTITHWVSVPGSESCDSNSPCIYQVPSISIIDLRRQGDRWWYVRRRDPPSNATPTPQTGLSFEETQERFRPYLEGFEDYESVQLESG